MTGKSKKDRLRQDLGTFMQQYQRQAQRGREPNDRKYDRKMEEKLKRLPPAELSAMLSGDDESDE